MKNFAPLIAHVSARSIYHMAGTERTGQYLGIAITDVGMVGIREFAPGSFRIRVEPHMGCAPILAAKLTRADGWKQAGDSGEYRFSTVTHGRHSPATVAAVTKALHAIVTGGNVPSRINSRAPAFARKALSHDGLVAAVRARKVAGANLASTWSMAKLCQKVGA